MNQAFPNPPEPVVTCSPCYLWVLRPSEGKVRVFSEYSPLIYSCLPQFLGCLSHSIRAQATCSRSPLPLHLFALTRSLQLAVTRSAWAAHGLALPLHSSLTSADGNELSLPLVLLLVLEPRLSYLSIQGLCCLKEHHWT